MEKQVHKFGSQLAGDDVITDPCHWLREAYTKRKRKNTNYSLRAYARDLGISHSLLSQVLNGHRPLTIKQAHKIAALLQLMPSEQKTFLDQVLLSLPENAKISQKIKQAREMQDASYLVRNVDVEKYHSISSWYHLSILDLVTTHDFKPDPQWIAGRLGISKIEVVDALDRLLLLGLLEKNGGTYQKASQHMHWVPQNSQTAIRAYHKQMLEKGAAELEKVDDQSFKRRSITGNSIAIDSARIDEAKQFIYEFEREFAKRFTDGKPDEVFQLNLQFFQITQNQKLSET